MTGNLHRGMTIHERFSVMGLFGEWDAAVTARDRERMITVLEKINLGDLPAASTADNVLDNPGFYGF